MHLESPAIPKSMFSHGFFTREGGISEGLYAGLNCGYGSGDAREKVQENRLRASAALSAKGEVVTCHQTHSHIAHVLDAPPETPLEGDALVTNQRALAIGVLTADCVPVLFADAAHKVVGAAHAGWKGAIGGIVPATIRAMESIGAKRKDIVAVVGPAISQMSYEVGADLYAKFMQDDYENAIFFKPSGARDHYFFNLKAYVVAMLKRERLARVELLDYDTYTDEARFYSFRRATHRQEAVYGRQLSGIVIL
jgi:polyphenol oxidase